MDRKHFDERLRAIELRSDPLVVQIVKEYRDKPTVIVEKFLPRNEKHRR